MFRLGMAAESVVFLVEIVLAALLYVLLRPVSASLALAAGLARVAEAVVQAVNLLTSALVLALVSGAGYLAVLAPEQRDALMMLFLDANASLVLVWGMFFGLHLLLLGYLVYRSGFWPRVIGVLLLLGSLGYLLQSFGHILTPQYDGVLSVAVIVLAVPGELVFTIWLLWKGINGRPGHGCGSGRTASLRPSRRDDPGTVENARTAPPGSVGRSRRRTHRGRTPLVACSIRDAPGVCTSIDPLQ